MATSAYLLNSSSMLPSANHPSPHAVAESRSATAAGPMSCCQPVLVTLRPEPAIPR